MPAADTLRTLLAAVLALLFATLASATEVERLYEAEVAVASREPADQEAALGAALSRVLVKVSGRRDVLASPVAREAIGAPGRFVQQFRYRTVSVPSADAQAAPATELRLWTRFDPAVVDGLLRDAGYVVWGRVRPAVIAWLAIEAAGRRELVGADDATGLGAALSSGAERRGVPVLLPLLDLDDRAAVQPSDVWGGFLDRIESASQRYGAEGILVGRIEPVLPTLWEARWQLRIGGSVHEWGGQADVAGTLVEEGIEEAADLMAERYASASGYQGESRVDLLVSGVRTLEDYARTLQYLESLDAVTRIAVTEVADDHVGLRAEVRGGSAAMRQVIGLGTTLATDETVATGSALRYRLVR